jgi:hypothetical protein
MPTGRRIAGGLGLGGALVAATVERRSEHRTELAAGQLSGPGGQRR